MSKIRIRTKLICLILVFFLVMGFVGFTGITQLQRMNSSVNYLYNQSVTVLIEMSNAKNMLNEIGKITLFYLLSSDADQRESLDKLISQTNDSLMLKFDEIGKLSDDTVLKANQSQMAGKLNEFNEYRRFIMEESQRGNRVDIYVNELIMKQNAIQNTMLTYENYQKQQSLNLYQQSTEVFKQAYKQYTLILAVGGLLILLLAFIVYRSIIKPLNSLTHSARQLENGDLRTEIMHTENKTEIGLLMSAFSGAVLTLRQIIQQVEETSQGVAAASKELANAATETGKGANQVASTVEELAKSSQEQTGQALQMTTAIDNMMAAVEYIKESYEQARNYTDKANDLAESGQKDVDRAIAQMETIKMAAYEMGDKVGGLEESSQKISEIVDIISSIAQQTNLLALNAAIEAARAGEHGRGFAVVAEEVRKLAEESSQSAQQIDGLIVTIQTGIKTAMVSMEKGAAEVNMGTDTIATTGKVFVDISDAIKKIADAIKNVGKAAGEINTGSWEVKQLIHSSLEVFESTAAYTEEVSATAEEQAASMEQMVVSTSNLSGMADGLQKAVEKFKL